MMRGAVDGEPLGARMGLAAALPLHSSATETVATSGGAQFQYRAKEERVPQWGQQETRELIAIRGELERDFTVARRNKALWEAVAARMRDRGFHRSPEQCKCKWKNLVNRYKGKETTDPENDRQMPFFDELHAIFNERARNMQQMLMDSESGASHSKKKLKRLSGERSDYEFSEDEEEEDEDDSDNERTLKSRKKMTNTKLGSSNQRTKAATNNSISNIREVLQEFLQQQRVVEMQWQEMMERRAQERRMLEQEWRQSMEKLERERLMMDKTWREREEQRRMREENRAEKRDALLTALLNKLIRDDI